MAVTTIRKVTGVAGAGNTGTGADVTWPSSGNPTYANSGGYFDFNDTGASAGTSTFSKTGTNTGDFVTYASLGQDAWWASGPSFIRAASGQNGPYMGFQNVAALTSLLGGGTPTTDVAFRVWFMFYTDPATFNPVADPTVTPANNPGAISMARCCTGTNVTCSELRGNTVNLAGFKPAVLLTGSAYGNEELAKALSANHNGHLEMNRWYQLVGRYKRSTSSTSNDGTIEYWLNGCCVMRHTNVGENGVTDNGLWPTAAQAVERFLSVFYGWTERTGVRICFGPWDVSTVPDADLSSYVTEHWRFNVERGMSLRRLWNCQWANRGLTITGTATLPTVGREVNNSGGRPGRTEFVITGTSGQTSLTVSPNIWDGDPETTPFGEDGWTHINFLDLVPNGGTVTVRVMDETNAAALCAVTIDDTGSGSVSVNLSTVLSGRTDVPAGARWQGILSIKAGQAYVWLHQLSLDSFTTKMIRGFPVSCAYVGGDGIGRAEISQSIGAINGPMAHGAIGAWADLDVLLGDSYTGAGIANAYAISGVNQGTKTFTVASMGTRNPPAGYKVRVPSGPNAGTYTVASSTSTTIVTVEAIPSATVSGSVDLVWPEYHLAAQRLGQFPGQACDADAIPNGYDPAPFGMTALAGFNAAIVLARSGGRLSDFYANCLSQLSGAPPMRVLMQCFDVNDTTATTSDAAAAAQAKALAGNKKLLVEWVAQRGGHVWFTPSPNLQDAGIVVPGLSNRFRRKTPAMVDAELSAVLHTINAGAGSFSYARVLDRLDCNAVTMTDGIHVDATPAQTMGYELHAALEANKSLSNHNADGSVRRISRAGGSRGPVVSPLV